MGIVNLQWMIVHTYGKDYIAEAYRAARDLFSLDGAEIGNVGAPQTTYVNGHCWFVIGPSGSKRGWHEDEAHRTALDKMVEWLKAYRVSMYPGHEGANPLTWALLEHQEEGNRFEVLDEGEDHDRGAL